jgi:hypothetical protein
VLTGVLQGGRSAVLPRWVALVPRLLAGLNDGQINSLNSYDLAKCTHYSFWAPACVEGISDPRLATCNSTGGNDTVPMPGYTCNTGYYVAPAPTYCARMSVLSLLPRGGVHLPIVALHFCTLLLCAACVPGLAPTSSASCDFDGTGDRVSANYTCNSGYYDSGAPAFCTRMCRVLGWFPP